MKSFFSSLRRKAGLVIDLVLTWFQVCYHEHLLKNIERNARGTEKFIDDLVKDIKEISGDARDFQVDLKLATEKEDIRAHREILDTHRARFAQIREELVA